MLPNLPPAILETILIRLAAFFIAGAAGDEAAARDAARYMLDTYRPETEDELCLAANAIGFSFQALEALAQSADRELPLTRILRLRSGAVSLNRESEKAQRHLHQIQDARRNGTLAATAEPVAVQAPPKIEKTQALIEDTKTISAVAKASGISWNQAYNLRQRAKRIVANLAKADAKTPATSNATI